MGLHRDATSWGIKDCELEERRRTFWEAQVFDRMQAMCFGRPLSLPDIHCKGVDAGSSCAPELTVRDR